MHAGIKYAGGWFIAVALGVFSGRSNAQSEPGLAMDDVVPESSQVASGTGASEPAASESGQGVDVYLIRERKFVGGGRDLWVAVNDKVVAALDNDSHVKLRLEPGLNSINAVQAKAGVAYAALDNRDGETVYAVVDYMGGTITEVPEEQGASMVRETKGSKALDGPRPNDAYDNLLINPELLKLGLIEPNAGRMEPDGESAVITFYRPAQLIAQVPFSLWSREGYVGSLLGKQYLQLRVAPGEHTFVAFSERLSVLNATVEAGKEYAVEFDVGMGWNQAHIKLLPVDLNAEGGKVDGWKAELAPVGVSVEALGKPEVAPRIARGFDYLKSIEGQWAAEGAASRDLMAGDGR